MAVIRFLYFINVSENSEIFKTFCPQVLFQENSFNMFILKFKIIYLVDEWMYKKFMCCFVLVFRTYLNIVTNIIIKYKDSVWEWYFHRHTHKYESIVLLKRN